MKAGETSATFYADAQSVATDTTVTVTATCPLGTATRTVLLKPNPLASASGPASVKGGTAATGRVDLGLYAIAVGEEVALACSDPEVTLPAKTTIPGPSSSISGYVLSKSQTFPISTPVVTSPRTVTITATRAGVTKSFDLTITP